MGNDVMDAVFYPLWQARLFARGHFALWNPWTDAGVPHAAALVGMVFSPLSYLPSLALGAPWGVALQNGAHLVGGALGMHLFLVRFLGRAGADPRAAGLGAIAWLLGGWMMIHRWAGHATLVHAAAFVPWGLLGLEIGSRRGGALLGIAAGMTILSGGLDLLAIAPAVWTGYALLRPHARLPTLLAGGLIALAVGAPQWILTLEHLPRSLRAELAQSAAFTSTYALPPQQLFSLLVPGAFGWFPDATYYGAASFSELWFYPGILVFLLAASALASPPPAVRREAVLFAVFVLLGAALSLGDATPLYPALREIPGVGLFRRPARWSFLLAVALPILAALGASRSDGTRRARLGAGFLVAGALVFVFRDAIGERLTGLLAETSAARVGGTRIRFAPLVVSLAVQAALVGAALALPRRIPVLVALVLCDLGPWAVGLHRLRRYEEYLPREVPAVARDFAPGGRWHERHRLGTTIYRDWYPGYDVQYEVPAWMGGYALGSGRIDAGREAAKAAGPTAAWWDRTAARRIVLADRIAENEDAAAIVRAGAEAGRWIVREDPNRFLASFARPTEGPWKIAVAWDPGWRATDPLGRAVPVEADEDGMILAHPDRPVASISFRFLPRLLLPALVASTAGWLLAGTLALRRE